MSRESQKGKSRGEKEKRAVKKVAIKDLPAKPAREDAIRGGAEPITGSKIKKL